MKTIIKLVVAAVILTGTVQAARAAIKHYSFVDAVQEAMLFAGSRTEEELADRVLDLAGDRSIPLDPASVAVRREPFLVVVDAPYTDTIDLIPGFYRHTWAFDTKVSVRQLEDNRPRRSSTPNRR